MPTQSLPRAAAVPALAGAALYCAAVLAPGSGFLAPSDMGRVASTLRTAEGLSSMEGQAEVPSSFGATHSTAATAACGLAAAAGLVAVARRRTQVAAKREPKGSLVIPWEVEPHIPVPGSEKAFATMLGADVETGSEPWDPMGFSKLYDRNFEFNGVMTYPHVQWLREAEIKHGRVCMIAFVGMVVQQFWQIPGLPQVADWTQALTACYESKVASLGIVQISAFTMFVEGRWYPGDSWIGQMDREPGDLGFDPLKFSKRPGFDLKKQQLKELKNGRLAMIGVASMAANHAIPGSVPFLTGAFAVRPEPLARNTASSLCGGSQPVALAHAQTPAKTAARYTTQVILPALQWLKVGLKAADLAPTQLVAKTIGGNDVLVGKDESGTLFCVANLCPHIGTPMSEGADVIGDVIVCPLHGSSFSTKTGDLIDWCPSPPIIGPLTGLVVDKKNLLIFDVRQSFFGGEIEVLVDTNAKKAYEAWYWKGILDAQGKNDGTYY